jgi:hypothetical protein
MYDRDDAAAAAGWLLCRSFFVWFISISLDMYLYSIVLYYFLKCDHLSVVCTHTHTHTHTHNRAYVDAIINICVLGHRLLYVTSIAPSMSLSMEQSVAKMPEAADGTAYTDADGPIVYCYK